MKFTVLKAEINLIAEKIFGMFRHSLNNSEGDFVFCITQDSLMVKMPSFLDITIMTNRQIKALYNYCDSIVNSKNNKKVVSRIEAEIELRLEEAGIFEIME